MLLSIFLSATICAVLVGLLVLNWQRIDATYGKGGMMLYVALVGIFPMQCLLWPLSLCPPLNQSDDPLILGTGGAVYGLNYKDYAVVTLLISAIPALSIAFLLVQSRWTPPQRLGSSKSVMLGLSSLLSSISMPMLCLSILFLMEFFRREGIDRIWSSPLDRFEGPLFDTGTEGGSQSGSPFLRIYLLFLFLSSIVASVGLAFRSRKYCNLCTLLVNIPPFLVWESRGLSVVASVGILGWVLSLKTPKLRRVALLPALLILLFIYQVPLILRELPGTGIVKFGAAARLVRDSDDYGFQGCAVRTLQSVSQCFPNFAYYYEEYDQGVNEMDQLPINYKLLAFSPTISLIDGWAENYMDLQLRVNYYTPISAWSELFLINPFLPYIVLTLFSATVLSLMRKMAEFPLGRLVFSPIVALLYTAALAMSSQYYSRTFSRFMWLTLSVAFAFVIINRLAAVRWMLKSQVSRAYGNMTGHPE
jgi:hypothetical protein